MEHQARTEYAADQILWEQQGPSTFNRKALPNAAVVGAGHTRRAS